MRTGIDPTVDCVFKKIFGSEQNKHLLLHLINSFLQYYHQPPVVDLQLLNPYSPRDFPLDKLSILDLKARTQEGQWFLIEVQIKMYGFFPKRLTYYWARSYQQQLGKGERYSQLHKVTLICITRENLPVGTQKFCNRFLILEQDTQTCLCEDLEIYTVELEKFHSPSEQLHSALECWSYFLKYGGELDDEHLPPPLCTNEIKQALEELKMFSQDEIERERYEQRQMALRDEESALYEEYRKGKQEGIQIGKQEGIQIGKQEGIKIVKSGIELSLKIKFGLPGLRAMEKIQALDDLARLQQIQQMIAQTDSLEQLLDSLHKQA